MKEFMGCKSGRSVSRISRLYMFKLIAKWALAENEILLNVFALFSPFSFSVVKLVFIGAVPLVTTILGLGLWAKMLFHFLV